MKFTKKINDEVFELLLKYPHLRDDDEALVANIWHRELSSMDIDSNELNTYGFFKLYSSKKITRADTITRARRRLQEENELLRGETYNQRQKSQSDVKKQLGYFKH